MRGSSAPSLRAWWSTEPTAESQPEGGKEHLDPFVQCSPQGNVPALLPGWIQCPSKRRGWHCPREGRASVTSLQCHGENVGTAGTAWGKGGAQRGKKHLPKTAENGAGPKIVQQCPNRSWAWPRSFAQSSIVSAKLCFPPLCPYPEHRGEINSSTTVSRREYIVI